MSLWLTTQCWNLLIGFALIWQNERIGSVSPPCAPYRAGAEPVLHLWLASFIIPYPKAVSSQRRMPRLSWGTTTITGWEPEGERDRHCVGGRCDESQGRGDLKYWRRSNHCSGVCSFFGRDGTFLFWWVTLSDLATLLTSPVLVPHCLLSHFLSVSSSFRSPFFSFFWDLANNGRTSGQCDLIRPGCDINTILWHYHVTAWHRPSNERRNNKSLLNTHTHTCRDKQFE